MPTAEIYELFFGERMQVAHEILQALFDDVGVDLRRRDITVPQQGLNDAQVAAIVQQVAGKGVAQDVWTDKRRCQAGGAGELF